MKLLINAAHISRSNGFAPCDCARLGEASTSCNLHRSVCHALAQWVFYSFAACALLWLPLWVPASVSNAPLPRSPARKDSGSLLDQADDSVAGSSSTQFYSTVSTNETSNAGRESSEPGAGNWGGVRMTRAVCVGCAFAPGSGCAWDSVSFSAIFILMCVRGRFWYLCSTCVVGHSVSYGSALQKATIKLSTKLPFWSCPSHLLLRSRVLVSLAPSLQNTVLTQTE